MKIFFVFSRDGRPNDVRRWLDNIISGITRDIELVTEAHLADVILVVGGDGTLLHTVHNYHHLNIPFLGIDRGTLGFNLNPIGSFDDLRIALNHFSEHDIVTLQLIKAEITRNNGEVVEHLAFNDVFAESPSMVNGRVITEGAYAMDRYFRGNGIIVATPQGSTAYTRSAKGRIIPLEEKLLAITSICPQGHSISKVSEMKRVEVRLESRDNIFVTADFRKVSNAVKFIVEPSGQSVRLIFTKASNYQIKRFHVEEEIEARRDRWIPENL